MIDSFFVTSTCMKVENDFFKILTMLLQRKFSSLMMSQRYTNNIFTNQFKEKKKVCVYFFYSVVVGLLEKCSTDLENTFPFERVTLEKLRDIVHSDYLYCKFESNSVYISVYHAFTAKMLHRI